MTSDGRPRDTEAPATRLTIRGRTRRHWRGARFSFEALLIVLSVLLGFGVSEWRQARADRGLADRVVDNLQAEIEYNRIELDRVLPRHRRILDLIVAVDTSDAALTGWDVILGVLQQAGGGLTPPTLRQGAWDAAISTGALRLLDYELVAGLSEIYQQQSTATEFYRRAIGTYEPTMFETGRQSETVQAFRWMVVELVNFESDLRETYARYQPRPDRQYENRDADRRTDL